MINLNRIAGWALTLTGLGSLILYTLGVAPLSAQINAIVVSGLVCLQGITLLREY